MRKTLSVVFASFLSFSSVLPAMAGTTPISPGTSTSNSPFGSGSIKTTLINISLAELNYLIELGSRDNVLNSLKGAGINEQLLANLVDQVIALIPLDANGRPSIQQGSVSIDIDKFNTVIGVFNSLVDAIDDDAKKEFLGNNKTFLSISAFLKSQSSK